MKSFTKMFMMLLMLCAAGASYADENVIYVQDAEIPVEEVQEVAQTIELSIWMKNTAPIRGFEFDMYLPEVISVKKNNKGRIQGVKFNAGRLPEDDEHTLTLSELSDGAVHFVCGSMYDETFTGNDGEIMIMEVNLSANVAVGNYPIQLKNIKLTETNPSNYYETELMESVFRVTGEPSLPNVVHDGTYYVMSAQEGTLINAENALDAKGVPITFTFSNNAYTIEGADFFTGKQWTVAEAIEGLSGYYTISNTDGFVAVSATNTLEQIADGTADAAIWILLPKTYWEDNVNSTYTIAGTKNLTGTENDWDIVDANKMEFNDNTGLYEKKFEGVVIENGNQPEFKVVQTNMEGNKIWYPNGDNWVITTSYVGGEGIYDITITFDPSDLKEIGVAAVEYEVYTEFDEATGTLTYYYDAKMASRSGVTEVYDPVNNPDAARFTGYYKKVLKAVIDPSMKNANLTSMYSMFFGGIHNETFAFQALSKMTEIKGMENLNTADVTSMDYMFEACNALKTIDVNSFDISKVTKMDFMFGDCYELTTIYCSKDWSITSASSDNMFGACRKLVGGNGTAFDSNVTNATYARPDGGTESPGYFTAGVVGDVNGDGVVNFTDAQSILTLMANENYESSADVNNDDAVNFTDYQSILTIMAQ